SPNAVTDNRSGLSREVDKWGPCRPCPHHEALLPQRQLPRVSSLIAMPSGLRPIAAAGASEHRASSSASEERGRRSAYCPHILAGGPGERALNSYFRTPGLVAGHQDS